MLQNKQEYACNGNTKALWVFGKRMEWDITFAMFLMINALDIDLWNRSKKEEELLKSVCREDDNNPPTSS